MEFPGKGNMSRGSERFMAEGTTGPGTEGARVVDTGVLYNRLTQTLLPGLKTSGVTPEQKAANAEEIAANVAELHKRKIFTANPDIQSRFRDQVFNNDPDSHLLSEKFVEGIEKQLVAGNFDLQSIRGQLYLATLFNINSQPDLDQRLGAISARVNQPTPPPTAEARGGQPPEEPTIPEQGWWPEKEYSPEYGRWLVEQFAYYRTKMTREERYGPLQGPRFKRVCDEIDKYVDYICNVRHEGDHWDPSKAYPKPETKPWDPNNPYKFEPGEFPPEDKKKEAFNESVELFLEEYKLERGESDQKVTPYIPKALPVDEKGNVVRVKNFTDKYLKPASRQEYHEAWANIDVFIRQAKNHGLLREVDVVLNTTFQEITRAGLSAGQIRLFLEQGLEEARRAGMKEFLEHEDVPEDFENVSDAYIEIARRTMEGFLHDRKQPRTREGEWTMPAPEQASKGKRETYWETTSWPKYYQVTAQTEDQFLIAKNTFFRMIRTAGLGKSPDAVYEHIQNFIEAFKGAGGKQVEEGNITSQFLTENRLELEALLFVFVGNYSNEVYNHKRRHEAMKAMSMDEGPARWVAIHRSGRGGVAAFTHLFDLEDLMDIYMNPVGERGELNIVSGHFLQDTIQKMVIERGMGIVLKDYDARDEFFNSDSLEAKVHAASELDTIKSKLEEYKKGLREGYLELDEKLRERKIKERVIIIQKGKIVLVPGQSVENLLSDHDRARYSALKANTRKLSITDRHEQFRRLYEGFENGDAHIKNFQHYQEDQNKPEGQRLFPPLDTQDKDGQYLLPESIRRSIKLGRVQLEVSGLRKAMFEGKIKPPPGKSAIDLLSPEDREIYKTAFEEAEANFDVAFQMQGVLGEKGRRGRGFIYCDRNPHIRYFFELGDDLRINQEKYTTLLGTKERDINLLNREQLDKLCNSLPEDKRNSFVLGYMLSRMRSGALLSGFGEDLQRFYKSENFSAEDREDFVDNIPVYEAENFVQWGIFWTKMKYADAPAKVRRQKVEEARVRLIEELRTRGYAARMLSDEIGHDGQPKIMTYKKPLGTIDPKTGEFRRFKNGEVIGYDSANQEIKLFFNEDGKPQGLEFDQDGKALIYDKNENRVIYGSLTSKTRAKLHQQSGFFIEEVEATFDFAAKSDDFRNRYTDHTYWYYQGNNRAALLSSRIFEAAQRIKDGVSRPEDEDILSVQLLIVDPTLKRVRKFSDVQQQREMTLIAAAVLESFQDKQRTRHAIHRAVLPKDGYEGRMRAGYRNEDWAGYDRFTMGFEEFVASQSLRFSRRAAAWIADAPMEHDSTAKWGVHGVGGAVRVMADEIKDIAHQGIIGQFGLTKLFNIIEESVKLYEALVGYTDPQTGIHHFGLMEKPTDNNEKLHENFADAARGDLLSDPSKAIPFLYKFIQAFGRLQDVTHIMRVIYSNVDNSAGAINLENIDVFLSDDSYNTAIESDKSIRKYNGTARNRQYAFLYGEGGWGGFYNWLVSRKPGGGSDVYPRERFWNSLLKQNYYDFEANEYRTYTSDEIAKLMQMADLLEAWLTEKII